METVGTIGPARFNGSVFDIGKGVLIRNGTESFLRPKATALLKLLASNQGRVVSKQEMFDAAWPGIFVTEDSLIQAIREIRKAIGDEHQSILRNVSRRGYILASDPSATHLDVPAPSVAVLRFNNETGEPNLTPIVDGFVEDIISGLARFGTVSVAARQSSFVFPSASRQAWAGARHDIGADYLVDGTVRTSANGFRVTINLVDAKQLIQLWGQGFEAVSASFFEIQDEIAKAIVANLAFRLEDAGIRRAFKKPTADLESYELMLRGVAMSRANTFDNFLIGEQLLEAAVARDPASGLALALLANVQVMRAGFGRAKRSDLDRILVTANKAVALAPEQAVAHRVLSFIQMYRGEHAAAEYHLKTSLDLNPCDAESVEQMGYLVTLRGRPIEALQWMDRAARLNPIHPQWYEHDRSFALYQLGEYKKAAEAIELTPILPPWMLTWLAACYAQLGELETAHYHIARVPEADPHFSMIDFARGNGAAFEHAKDNDHFAEGVFLALGIPLE